jgi:hypothetical protein
LNVPFICSAAVRKGVPADFPFGNISTITYDTSGKSCARYGVFPYGVFTPSRMVANPALTSPVGMARIPQSGTGSAGRRQRRASLALPCGVELSAP